MLSLTDGNGVDIIFENGGVQTLTRFFKCVAFGGLINCIGYLSGKVDENGDPGWHTNVLALSRNVTLKGHLSGPKERFEEMLTVVDDQHVRMIVDRVFQSEEAKNALVYLLTGNPFGKVVVKV